MLNEREVLYAKTKMKHILNGTERCPEIVSRKASMLLHALNAAIRGGKSCDWMACHSADFLESLRSALVPFASMDRFGVGALVWGADGGQWKDLLDHHYWNDCDPWWHGGGRYGATPGEDVMIKLIANKC